MRTVIAFDGLSGAGKTTCTKILLRLASLSGLSVFSLNEKEYEPIRSWVIAWHQRPNARKVFSLQDVYDFAKARAIVHEGIRRSIPADTIIHFDRSIWTSAVYQQSEECGADEVLKINVEAGAIVPDQTLLFLARPEECYRRILARASKITTYNLPAQVESFEQVSLNLKRYRKISTLIPNCTEIDCEASIDIVARQAVSAISDFLCE